MAGSETTVLSIITVNLNDKNGLEKTLLSVRSQTYKNYEHIIIDGGSTDGSKELIEKYIDSITYWVSEKDSGIYNAMNKGIAKAKGKYCLLLNSGDFLHDKNILNEVFSHSYSEDLIYCDLIYDLGDGKMESRTQPSKMTFKYLYMESLFHPSTFIKKGLFEILGLYDESFRIVSDYDFFFNAIVIHNVSERYLPLNVAVHNTKGISSMPENFEIIKKERALVHKKYLPNMVVESLDNFFATINSSNYSSLHQLNQYPFLLKIVNLIVKVIIKIKSILGRK